MNSNIQYTIKIHSYWHAGSGLAAGADVDALVLKDERLLPYLPGKTVKGLLREAVDDLRQFEKTDVCESDYNALFGQSSSYAEASQAFFTNAELQSDEAGAIVENGLVRFLYDSIASTAIGDGGVAEDHSLRKFEVTVPCTLHGTIQNVPESMCPIVVRAFGMIKNLGVNRNRGLGRCTWKEV